MDGFWTWLVGIFWGNPFFALASWLNCGLTIGGIFVLLILLRPVTNFLLRPRQRVVLWSAGWFALCFFGIYRLINILPVGFQALLLRGVNKGGGTPAFFPERYTGAGTYAVTLPGGIELPLYLDNQNAGLFILLGLTLLVVLLVRAIRGEKRWEALCRQGEKMEPERMAQFGITQEDVQVRLCDGLPTSLVCDGVKGEARYSICLQRELPEERLRLVLLHETAHIRRRDVWYKGCAYAMTLLHFWNPVFWLAYRLTSRDIELACDEAVMEKLDEGERRDYARALVELASGRYLWGSLTTFGECDAALRVKRLAAWKPQRKFFAVLSWLLTALLLLFFYCG